MLVVHDIQNSSFLIRIKGSKDKLELLFQETFLHGASPNWEVFFLSCWFLRRQSEEEHLLGIRLGLMKFWGKTLSYKIFRVAV